MTKVSVVIPAYNPGKFIISAVESVLNQYRQADEIILVDDGSVDNTKELLSPYIDKITYVYKENKGASSARNKGILLSQGDLILFLDADDEIELSCIKQHCRVFDDDKDAVLSYAALTFINSRGERLGGVFRSKGYNHKEFFIQMLERNLIATPSGVMIRREILKELGGFNEGLAYNEEYELWLKIARGYRVSYSDIPLTRYRRHNDNISRNRDKQAENERKIIRGYDEDFIIKAAEEAFSDKGEMALLIGKIFFKIEEYDKAVLWLQSSLTLNSSKDGSEAYIMLGNSYYMIKDYKQAAIYYEEAIRVNKDRAEVYNNLGVLTYINGDKGKSIELFNRSLSLRPHYNDPEYNLSLLQDKTMGAELKVTLRPLRDELVPYLD